MRASDTVARLGGDEFVLLVESGHAAEDATAVAEKVLTAFIHPFDLDGNQVRMWPSIGISLYPNHGCYESVLLSHAAAAMYQSKKNGGNQVRMASATCAPGLEPQEKPHSAPPH